MSNTPLASHLVAAEILFAAVVFVLLFFVTAPYGRHVRRGWGPTISSRASWMLMESPAFFVIPATALLDVRPLPALGLALLLLWQVHYVYRTFVYPLLLTAPQKPFPVVLTLMAILFNTMNGYINGDMLLANHRLLRVEWLWDPRFLLGVALFIGGFLTHVSSDAHLRSLRRSSYEGYRIPRRGLARLVSNPHYFGEILEWVGWAVATWSMAGLAFALFTIANLAPRALSNHRWYRSTFPDYPRSRRVLIPFVW